MVRASSLQALNTLSVNREIDSKYDAVLAVRDKLSQIEIVAGMNVEALLVEMQEATDFEGISVVAGDVAGWDPVNKIITVPTIKGDTGDKGDTGATGPIGPQGLSIVGPQGPKGDRGNQGIQGVQGTRGETGAKGDTGEKGENLTVEQIVYNGDGTFTWQFSDGTSYVTPNLKGPKGDTGTAGAKGDTGIGVHHIKGTSTTNPNGDFGTSPFIDTYTVYGDADEIINLGHFVVTNGVSDGMSISVYDKNGNGIVDNSERLGGILAEDVFAELDGKYSINGGVISGDVTVTGDLVVNGDQMIVNTETVLAKDNLLVINDGEVGPGVTKGEAGIEINRGTAENYKFVFVESDDSFKVGVSSGLQKVATREDSPLNTGVAVWDGVNYRFNTTRNVDVDTISFEGSGQVSWNTNESTLDVVLGASTLQVGQETLVKVRASTDIGNGKVVMATGSLGNSGRIVVGLHDGTRSNGKRIVGVATHDIGNGSDGFVTAFGKVRNINTTGSSVGETWLDGDVLYVKPGDAGNLTKIVPLDSELMMPVAFVVHAHTNGTLFVRVSGIDENKVATSARKLETARSISLTGDVTGTVNFDGSANASITTTITANSVALGTDTTGNYVAGVTQGTGITVSGTAGEGWSPTISITNVGTAGTYTKVTTNAQGQVTAGATLSASDIPSLDASKITSGTLSLNTTGSAATLTTSRTIGMTGDVTWTSSAFNGSGNVTGTSTLATITDSGTGSFVKITKNTKGLVTGTTPVVQSDITSLLGSESITNAMLPNSGVTAGTYDNVTVDVKGRVTTGTNNDSANISALVI